MNKWTKETSSVKPVKVNFNGKIIQIPYFLEIDFMVDDLLQKHKSDMIKQFFEKKIYTPDRDGTGGNQIRYNNDDFEKKITDMFLNVIKNNFVVDEKSKCNVIPWVYIQSRDRQHNELHNHIGPTPTSIASTCYTDVPKNGGDFEFYYGNPYQRYYRIKPKKNKLYLFPGWLFHAPTPQEDEKPRICINLEYCSIMRPKIKGKENIIW